jgi:hypothetical protein
VLLHPLTANRTLRELDGSDYGQLLCVPVENLRLPSDEPARVSQAFVDQIEDTGHRWQTSKSVVNLDNLPRTACGLRGASRALPSPDNDGFETTSLHDGSDDIIQTPTGRSTRARMGVGGAGSAARERQASEICTLRAKVEGLKGELKKATKSAVKIHPLKETIKSLNRTLIWV